MNGMRPRWFALIGALVIASALLAPATASAAADEAFSLRVAAGGHTASVGGGDQGGAHQYLPIHPDAYKKAKAAANRRAAAQAVANSATPSAVQAGTASAAGWDGQVDPSVTPPDPTGAIGPTRYIELVNLRFGIYDRNGALISSGPLANLTNVTQDNLSDPQILWDPDTRHFYYLVLDFTTNEFAIGWSKDESPNGPADFCQYVASYGYGAFYLPDYPKLGTSKDFLLIGANVFFNFIFQSYVGSDVDWLDKPPAGPLTTCPDPSTFHLGSFSSVQNADGSAATTPVPAVQTDPDGNGWVVATPDASTTPNASFLTLFRITGTKATGASISPPVTVSVPGYDVPASAPQPNGPVIDTLDGRLERAVSGIDPLHGNVDAVWTAHAVYGGAGSEERWYEIDPSAGVLLQSGKASSPSQFVWNGAVSPDRAVDNGSTAFGGNMVMGFNTSSSTAFPAIQMVTKVGANPQSDFAMVKQSPGVNYDFSCSSPYGPPCRWGDYSGASADPTPDLSCPTGSVWLSGEWNLASTDNSGVDWRTWNWQASPQACSSGATLPGAPTLTSATAGDASVDLAWTPPASDGGSPISGYRIYRGTSSGGETLLTSVVVTTTFHDASVTNGVTYYYEVAAMNGVGEGPRSNELAATPTAPSGVPGAPTLSAKALRTGGVKLTWTVPSSGGSSITGYNVYRGTSSTSQPLLVSLGPVTTYTDTTTARSVTYWYYVTAINANGEGPKSNLVKIRAR